MRRPRVRVNEDLDHRRQGGKQRQRRQPRSQPHEEAKQEKICSAMADM